MKYVYLMRAGANHYKVGVAVSPAKRIGGVQTGNPLLVELVCCRLVENAEEFEGSLHRQLVEQRSNGGTEWFELTPPQALDLAVQINRTPEIDITKQITAKEIVERQKLSMKRIEAKLDAALEDYERVKEERQRLRAERKAIREMPLTGEEADAGDSAREKTDDDYINEAIIVVRQAGKASTSLLQRRLRLGYGRAARIIERMEEMGIVGPADGSHPREILADPAVKAAINMIDGLQDDSLLPSGVVSVVPQHV